MANEHSTRDLIREAVALFDDAEQLERAVSDLQGAGFDRADISLLAHSAAQPRVGGTPHLAQQQAAPREAPVTHTDIRQERLLGTSLAATVAAFAAAGFTVATGGALAVAAVAAAAAGGGVGAIGAWMGARLGRDEVAYFDRQLEKGGVLLWVRLDDPAAETRARGVLERYTSRVEIREFAANAPPNVQRDDV